MSPARPSTQYGEFMSLSMAAADPELSRGEVGPMIWKRRLGDGHEDVFAERFT